MSDVLLEGAAGTLLHHNVAEILMLDNLVGLDHIGIMDSCHSLLLTFQQVSSNFVVDLTHVDCLDGHRLKGVCVGSWVTKISPLYT